ncbi:MAG TPA: HlyD family type I secretion periplasmic adaptor subunit, partial [Tabrizicola sp.]|nr:HlyD family type I secretion periplasmic adaptor subunit [Tabrizicola sp.]
MQMAPPARKPRTALGRAGVIAAFVSLSFVAGTTAWAFLTEIGSAVVATGAVTIEGKPKSIQHLDGGIVQEILVSDGDLVEAGQVLMRLDPNLLSANLTIYLNRLAELVIREARLQAELDGSTSIKFPPAEGLLAGRPMEDLQAGETSIFEARAAIQSGRKAQLEERILQYGNQIEGLAALISAKREQAGYIDTEIGRLTTLQEKGLARENQVLTLQGTRADLLGQVAEHISETARVRNSIRDTELEILQIARQFREEVLTQLHDTKVQKDELIQQITSTQTQLDRIDIRAPVRGLVHEMQVVTLGGVVPPGAVIGQIIPVDGLMTFDLQIAPTDIDSLYAGQEVRLRFPAFNQRKTPEIIGTLIGLSPSTIKDEVTGMT